jgi:hypothetical protein
VISGYDLGSSGWVNSSTESSKIAEDLKITRAPYGMTPYGEGLSATEALFASTPEISKPKVAIFVTDGLPTDQDPYISLQKANSLKASGVKIISILVSSKDKNSMITEHKSFLEGIGGEEKPWYSPDYTSYEQYFSSLLGDGSKEGLLVSMSDDVIYLKDSSELKNAFDSIIGEQALSCK